MSDISRIIVTIEGGVVTAVIAETEGKAQPRLPVTIVNYDDEEADEWDLTFIYQTDGTLEPAIVAHRWTETSDIAFPRFRDPREG